MKIHRFPEIIFRFPNEYYNNYRYRKSANSNHRKIIIFIIS